MILSSLEASKTTRKWLRHKNACQVLSNSALITLSHMVEEQTQLSPLQVLLHIIQLLSVCPEILHRQSENDWREGREESYCLGWLCACEGVKKEEGEYSPRPCVPFMWGHNAHLPGFVNVENH